MARCTTLCDKVCQWLATGRWFSPGPPVSATNKTDSHDITEILLKVALNTIKQTNKGKFSKIQVTENITYNEIRQIDCQNEFSIFIVNDKCISILTFRVIFYKKHHY